MQLFDCKYMCSYLTAQLCFAKNILGSGTKDVKNEGEKFEVYYRNQRLPLPTSGSFIELEARINFSDTLRPQRAQAFCVPTFRIGDPPTPFSSVQSPHPPPSPS